jgi:hypothetical protein
VYLEGQYIKDFSCTRVYSDRHVICQDGQYEFENDTERISDETVSREGRIGFRSGKSLPIIHACRESYEYLSKFYTRSFGSKVAFPDTWFNFERDILYLNLNGAHQREQFKIEELSEDVTRVENLALINPRWHAYHDDGFEGWLNAVFTRCTNLRNLYLVARRHDDSDAVDLVLAEQNIDHEYTTGWFQEVLDDFRKGTFSHQWEHELNQEWTCYREDLYNLVMPDMDELRRLKHEQELAGGPTYTMPNIEVRIVTTAAKEEEYQWASNAYRWLRDSKHGLPRFCMNFKAHCKTDRAGERAFELLYRDYLLEDKVSKIHDDLRTAWNLEAGAKMSISCAGIVLEPHLYMSEVIRMFPDSMFNAYPNHICESHHDHFLDVEINV